MTSHRRLTLLIGASTKLNDASRLVKEATIDIAHSGLLPVEAREEARKIAAAIDTYIQRRITSAIDAGVEVQRDRVLEALGATGRKERALP